MRGIFGHVTMLLAAMMLPLGTASAQKAAPRMLETDVDKASTTCWIATVVNGSNSGWLDSNEVADGMWFVIEAARLSPSKGPVTGQLQARASAVPADPQVVGANAADIARQCAKRWPKSVQGSQKIVLPTDRFERELLCTGVASLLLGVADEEEKNGHTSRLRPVAKAINDRGTAALTNDELAKRGIAGQEELLARYDLALAKAVTMGNLNDLVQACA